MKTIDTFLTNNSAYLAPIGRLLITFMFIMSGFSKMSNYSNTAAWMESLGVSGGLLPIVIGLEIFGGIAILVGWQVRVISLLLAGFCILTAIVFHTDFTDQNQMTQFMKNITIAGGFVFLVTHGAGNFSLDNRKID